MSKECELIKEFGRVNKSYNQSFKTESLFIYISGIALAAGLLGSGYLKKSGYFAHASMAESLTVASAEVSLLCLGLSAVNLHRKISAQRKLSKFMKRQGKIHYIRTMAINQPQ